MLRGELSSTVSSSDSLPTVRKIQKTNANCPEYSKIFPLPELPFQYGHFVEQVQTRDKTQTSQFLNPTCDWKSFVALKMLP